MKQKIAILIHNMAGGGAERYVSLLLDHLQVEYEIHLLLFENIVEYDLPEGQIITCIEKGYERRSNLLNILRFPLASFRLVKYCKQNDIKLVVSFLNRPNFAACFAKLLGLKIPVLISEQAFTPLWFKENSIRGKVAKRFVSWLYPLADGLLPNSHGTKIALRDHYGIKGNYFVIKNIVDIELIDREKLEAIDDIAFNKFTFICVAGFRPQKNHRILIDAFAKIQSLHAQLLLIGKGPLLKTVQKQVTSLGLDEKVLFLGHKSNPFKYMHNADCFVLSSDFEGFPNVLIEALACGLPILSTDCPTGPRELLAPETDSQTQLREGSEDGEYGILVPIGNSGIMADAISKIIDGKARLSKYQKRARGKAMEYEPKTVINEFKQIIDDHLTSSPTSA